MSQEQETEKVDQLALNRVEAIKFMQEEIARYFGNNGYLLVENIAAPNLDISHTFTVTDGADTYTVTASALSYAYTSVKSGTEARRDLGKALYLYSQAADAMFGN